MAAAKLFRDRKEDFLTPNKSKQDLAVKAIMIARARDNREDSLKALYVSKYHVKNDSIAQAAKKALAKAKLNSKKAKAALQNASAKNTSQTKFNVSEYV